MTPEPKLTETQRTLLAVLERGGTVTRRLHKYFWATTEHGKVYGIQRRTFDALLAAGLLSRVRSSRDHCDVFGRALTPEEPTR